MERDKPGSPGLGIRRHLVAAQKAAIFSNKGDVTQAHMKMARKELSYRSPAGRRIMCPVGRAELLSAFEPLTLVLSGDVTCLPQIERSLHVSLCEPERELICAKRPGFPWRTASAELPSNAKRAPASLIEALMESDMRMAGLWLLAQ